MTYGGTLLKTNGTMTGKRLAALIRIRDEARLVLQSQNEGWPEAHREEARRELNRVYDVFVQQYGLINKTTFSESKTGTIIQRMPNLVKFIEDPDAMLVMALEDCDPTSGTAVKAAIMRRDVVGRAPAVTTVASAEEGLLVSLDQKGEVDSPTSPRSTGPKSSSHRGAGRPHLPGPGDEGLADGRRVPLGERAGEARRRRSGAGPDTPETPRRCGPCSPRTCSPARSTRTSGPRGCPRRDIQAFAAELFGVPASSISIGHLKKDAVWSVEAG